MKFRNLTPHPIHIFHKSSFVGLEQLNPTTWIADGCAGQPLLELPSEGCLRIKTETKELESLGRENSNDDLIPLVETKYGEVTGCPEDVDQADILIVSLPSLSMAKAAGHPLASQMTCPYQVVRQRGNTSVVLGAMGLSK